MNDLVTQVPRVTWEHERAAGDMWGRGKSKPWKTAALKRTGKAEAGSTSRVRNKAKLYQTQLSSKA